MVLLEDKGQKVHLHKEKHQYFDNEGIEVIRVPLPVGDYVLINEKVQDVIDRKNGRKKQVGKETVTLKNGKKTERNIYEYGVDLKKMDFVGTYSVCVDTKKDIEELISDIVGKQHSRFRDELIFAHNNGIKLYILVENRGGLIKGTRDIYNKDIHSLDELHLWKNPRLFLMKDSAEIIGYYGSGKPRYKKVQKFPTATRGEALMKACYTMQNKYGAEFLFCKPEESGKILIDLLGGVKKDE